MLTDPAEIAIIAKAKQKNVRDPKRSREHFFNIIEDFFDGVELNGRYVDLGPGQFDLGEIVKQKGGTCLGVDFDPAVIELGRYKGFDVAELNMRQLPEHEFGEKFDGVFNKFSINAFWTPEDKEHTRMVEAVTGLAKPDGWGWIGPWNGVPKTANYSAPELAAILDKQKALFEAAGYATVDLTVAQSRRYGISGTVANNRVFIRNLEWRPKR